MRRAAHQRDTHFARRHALERRVFAMSRSVGRSGGVGGGDQLLHEIKSMMTEGREFVRYSAGRQPTRVLLYLKQGIGESNAAVDPRSAPFPSPRSQSYSLVFVDPSSKSHRPSSVVGGGSGADADRSSMSLALITELSLGRQSKVLVEQASSTKEDRCFSISTSSGFVLDLEAVSANLRVSWVYGLTALLKLCSVPYKLRSGVVSSRHRSGVGAAASPISQKSPASMLSSPSSDHSSSSAAAAGFTSPPPPHRPTIAITPTSKSSADNIASPVSYQTPARYTTTRPMPSPEPTPTVARMHTDFSNASPSPASAASAAQLLQKVERMMMYGRTFRRYTSSAASTEHAVFYRPATEPTDMHDAINAAGFLYWSPVAVGGGTREEDHARRIPLRLIRDVTLGRHAAAFQSPFGAAARDDRCFSVVGPVESGFSLDLEAATAKQCVAWAFGIMSLIKNQSGSAAATAGPHAANGSSSTSAGTGVITPQQIHTSRRGSFTIVSNAPGDVTSRAAAAVFMAQQAAYMQQRAHPQASAFSYDTAPPSGPIIHAPTSGVALSPEQMSALRRFADPASVDRTDPTAAATAAATTTTMPHATQTLHVEMKEFATQTRSVKVALGVTQTETVVVADAAVDAPTAAEKSVERLTTDTQTTPVDTARRPQTAGAQTQTTPRTDRELDDEQHRRAVLESERESAAAAQSAAAAAALDEERRRVDYHERHVWLDQSDHALPHPASLCLPTTLALQSTDSTPVDRPPAAAPSDSSSENLPVGPSSSAFPPATSSLKGDLQVGDAVTIWLQVRVEDIFDAPDRVSSPAASRFVRFSRVDPALGAVQIVQDTECVAATTTDASFDRIVQLKELVGAPSLWMASLYSVDDPDDDEEELRESDRIGSTFFFIDAHLRAASASQEQCHYLSHSSSFARQSQLTANGTRLCVRAIEVIKEQKQVAATTQDAGPEDIPRKASPPVVVEPIAAVAPVPPATPSPPPVLHALEPVAVSPSGPGSIAGFVDPLERMRELNATNGASTLGGSGGGLDDIPPLFGSSVLGALTHQSSFGAHSPDLDFEIPLVLPALLRNIVDVGGHRSEGIFRVSPNSQSLAPRIAQLEDGDYGLEEPDPDVSAALVKVWLRRLAEPLIPPRSYDQMILIGRQSRFDIRTPADADSMHLITRSLPSTHAKTLLTLLLFLRRLVTFAASNRMSAKAFGVVFAPSLVRPADPDAPGRAAQEAANASHAATFVERLILSAPDCFPPQQLLTRDAANTVINFLFMDEPNAEDSNSNTATPNAAPVATAAPATATATLPAVDADPAPAVSPSPPAKPPRALPPEQRAAAAAAAQLSKTSPAAAAAVASTATSPPVAAANLPALFGTTVDDALAHQAAHGHGGSVDLGPLSAVPLLLLSLLSGLVAHRGHRTDGIFRVQPTSSALATLRRRYQAGEYDLDEPNPHASAAVLKGWLRDMTSPLLPTERIDDMIAIGARHTFDAADASDADALSAVFSALDRPRAQTLLTLTLFLQRLATHAASTRMDTVAIGVVFAPLLARAPRDDDMPFLAAFVERVVRGAPAGFRPDDVRAAEELVRRLFADEQTSKTAAATTGSSRATTPTADVKATPKSITPPPTAASSSGPAAAAAATATATPTITAASASSGPTIGTSAESTTTVPPAANSASSSTSAAAPVASVATSAAASSSSSPAPARTPSPGFFQPSASLPREEQLRQLQSYLLSNLTSGEARLTHYVSETGERVRDLRLLYCMPDGSKPPLEPIIEPKANKKGVICWSRDGVNYPAENAIRLKDIKKVRPAAAAMAGGTTPRGRATMRRGTGETDHMCSLDGVYSLLVLLCVFLSWSTARSIVLPGRWAPPASSPSPPAASRSARRRACCT